MLAFKILRAGLSGFTHPRMAGASLLWLVFTLGVPVTQAVTCIHCKDTCEGCTGSDSCPLLVTIATNVLVVSGAAEALGKGLSIISLLPKMFFGVLTRTVLNRLLSIARLPSADEPVDLSTATAKEVRVLLNGGRITLFEALQRMEEIVEGASDDDLTISRAPRSSLIAL